MSYNETEHALRVIGEIVSDASEDLRSEEMNGAEARIVVEDALFWLGRALGDDLLRLAYGESAGDRASILRTLARRIQMSARVYRGVYSPSDQATLESAVAELAAIADGDEPLLFARIGRGASSSEGKVAYRLAHYQALALYWAEVFRIRGVKPAGLWQGWISAAYCHLSWDTIRKWEAKVDARLEGRVQSLYRQAHYQAESDKRFGVEFDLELARELLTKHGQEFDRIQRLAAGIG